ncbi:MAG: carboxypeptidase-like regulatory domain-containing protein [Bacteroidota bacterium]
MKKISTILFTLLLLSAAVSSRAQTDSSDFKIQMNIVQFSGVVVTADSLKPVPFVNIFDKTTGRGTVSDYFGFFSFVAMKGDTIMFSSLGFKRSFFVIPDTLTENRYSMIQMMQNDTIVLKQMFVYPWPSREQFKQAFLTLEIPDDYVAKAERNMQIAELRAQAYGLPNDGSMAYKSVIAYEQYKLYHAGQLPTTNLFNPIAWYKFVEAWKRGDFKKKD